jgi:hypothetical protein
MPFTTTQWSLLEALNAGRGETTRRFRLIHLVIRGSACLFAPIPNDLYSTKPSTDGRFKSGGDGGPGCFRIGWRALA